MPCFLFLLLLLLAAFFIYLIRGGPTLPPQTDAIIDEVLHGELPELVVGQAGFATSDGRQIWYECISPDGVPRGVVMLLTGMGGNSFFWPPSFVRGFVQAGYQVIRYDHRGTGMSDWVKDWSRKRPYSLTDMAGDALAVLDALQVEQAHLFGHSMGGMIAQEMAIRWPGRVASLTLLMTSGDIGDPELPGWSSRHFLNALVKGLPLLKYRLRGGERNLIKEVLAKMIIASGYEGLDVRETAVLVLYDLRRRRGVNVRAIWQHQTAIFNAGSRYEQLSRLSIPTLVIHGTADQLIPVAHGRKLAQVIPAAKGVWLEGVGHVFPVPDMPLFTMTVFKHLDGR